jgi:Undecaprenyl-phosphate galactose phosphotransferase WbaP
MIIENSIAKIQDAKIRKANFNVHTRQWMGRILLATDMLSLLIAIFIAMQAHPELVLTIESPYTGIFLLLGSTIAYLFLRRGLYPPVGMHYADELRHIVTTTSLAFLIIIGVTFALKTTAIYSRLELILTWMVCLPLIPLSRYIVRRLLIRLGLWGESVVIVGDLNKAKSLAAYFRAKLQYGILPVAMLNDQRRPDKRLSPCPLLSICKIKLFARNLSVKTVLIVLDDFNDIDEIVKRYRDAFQWMILVKDQYKNYGLTFLKPLDFLDVLGLQVKNNLLSSSAQVLKRVMDITLSFFGLLLLAPLLTLIAITIKWESRGDVFYRQRRLGKSGQIFNVLKFRTMHQNAAEILKEKMGRDPALKNEWDRFQKLRDDPRITRAGRFLRRFSLDELPQLWNILKGEMSLVGPRPMMVDQLELYGKNIKECFQVRPGITGLWQVSGRNQTTFAQRAEFDLEYIQRWSVWFDIYILLKTIKAVIQHDGAY